jgi:hypothetical protein
VQGGSQLLAGVQETFSGLRNFPVRFHIQQISPRPSTSLSASLAGEPLATLKTETAYRALIKPSVSPIRSLNLHHNRIASKVLNRRPNAQCDKGFGNNERSLT